ncbi:ZF-HD homeobox protein, Cys/His-rich dimerization domain [Dillenia turbinata]|uniref:ZF-HD homeobox protein, Cys/His-rich dimerization domain n=1 Tax=Dillenia turbinata TaxID=194707 RepID=A0AAN8V3L7_9MAGN
MENQGKDANSLAYNLPIQESPSSKISSPSGEKKSSTDHTKVTSTIFNQTQDHHHHHLQEFSKQDARSGDQRNPDPDHHHHPATTVLAIASTSASNPSTSTITSASLVHYKECLRNHAASTGGHVLDGCGEFMPGGEEGTPEALKCAACDCHRNFHRKEIKNNNNNGLLSQQQPSTVANNCYVYGNNNNNKSNQRNRVVSPPPPPHHHRRQPQYPSLLPPPQQHRLAHFMCTNTKSPQRAPMMVAFGGGGGGGGGAPAEYSSSEDLNNDMYQSNAETMQGREQFEYRMSSKKRFRTKFSQEQKDKMHEFAEKLGWKMQKQDDDEVQQFCSQVGVKRQVFKVWMHNNKQAMKKREL